MSPVVPSLGNVVIGALLGWIIFTALTGWLVFSAMMSTTLSLTSGIQPYSAEAVLSTVSTALVMGLWTLVVAGSVSFIVTAVLGVPLGWLAATILRRVSAEWAHVSALFAVGAIASSVTVLVFGQTTSGWLGSEFLPVYLVAGVLAGTSAAFGWVILSKVPPRPAARTDYAESVASL